MIIDVHRLIREPKYKSYTDQVHSVTKILHVSNINNSVWNPVRGTPVDELDVRMTGDATPMADIRCVDIRKKTKYNT